jgi:hypothetical protein
MPDETSPSTAVARLVAAAGIRRIVCVDDAFAAGLEELLETLAGFTSAQRASASGLDPERMEVPDVWQQAIRDRWDGLDETERASLVDQAYAIAGDATPVPAGAMHALRKLLPELESEGLSLAEWRARGDELLAGLESTPTLILFDQDFHHEGGGTEEGQRLIAELESALAKRGPVPPDAYYGLLTNTVEVDNEHARRDEIVGAGGLDPARFVLISKQNLADEELRRFASRLRTILLAPLFVDLLDEVTGEVRATQDAALAEVRAIPPEDLEHMVVRTSVREGVWEPDTLLRILEAMQRAKARERLRQAERVVTLTRRLREIAEIDPDEGVSRRSSGPDAAVTEGAVSAGESVGVGDPGARQRGDEPTPVPVPAAVRISHKEIYESSEHVNGLHLPIEVGDLLERGSGKRYVVVAQPCDLMVRPGGLRAPEVTHVLVAELAIGAVPGPDLFAEFKLPYFDQVSGNGALVRLARPTFVRALILDSCVLNIDGCARLDLRAPRPEGMLPHWHARSDKLQKLGGIIFGRLRKLQGDVAEEVRIAMTGHFKGDVFAPTTIDVEAQMILWDCRRIGRICDPYARALLSRYSQYFARDAYLHDLARR